MFKKIDQLTIYALLVTLASIIFIYLIHSGKSGSMDRERKAQENRTEAKAIGFTLSETSDYLTREVRLFAITLNPEHMRNYWREVNVTKRREGVIKRLKAMHAPKEEMALLAEAKNNSDALVTTETHAQRLILEVFGVPEAQMEPMVRDFQLTQEDRELSDNDKINKSRELLYNNQYAKDKERIMVPIQKFQTALEARIGAEIEDASKKTDTYDILSSLWMIALTLLIFVFTYNVITRVATPLKDLRQQLKANASTVEISDSAFEVIKNITQEVNELKDAKNTEA